MATAQTASREAGKKPAYSKKTKRAQFRKKLKEKLTSDKEFAKKFFEEKSKRSTERKTAFRKRHQQQK